jgi:hypothetical protein
MVYPDSEDLCYRENVVIAKAMSKYGSKSIIYARIGKGDVYVSEKYKSNKTLVDVKNILASHELENEIIKE